MKHTNTTCDPEESHCAPATPRGSKWINSSPNKKETTRNAIFISTGLNLLGLTRQRCWFRLKSAGYNLSCSPTRFPTKSSENCWMKILWKAPNPHAQRWEEAAPLHNSLKSSLLEPPQRQKTHKTHFLLRLNRLNRESLPNVSHWSDEIFFCASNPSARIILQLQCILSITLLS